jgi:hypothetical protein
LDLKKKKDMDLRRRKRHQIDQTLKELPKIYVDVSWMSGSYRNCQVTYDKEFQEYSQQVFKQVLDKFVLDKKVSFISNLYYFFEFLFFC